MDSDTKIGIAILIVIVSIVVGSIWLNRQAGITSCTKLSEMIGLNTTYTNGCYIEVQPNVWIYESNAKYYLRGGESDE